MGKYLFNTALSVIPTLFGVVTVVFLLIHLAPGDPALQMAGPYATKETVEQLRKNLGLDKPLHLQYIDFIGNILRADFGKSIVSNESVFLETLRPLPYTIELAVAGVLISIILGVPIGVLSAVRRNSFLDYLGRLFSISGISIPTFFLALLLLLLFSYKLKWFPTIGVGDSSSWVSLVRHLVLPGLAVGIYNAGLNMRLTRSCMLEVLSQDYIRTARAKGLTERSVILVHGLRNALLPLVTVIGLTMGQLLGGAIITESVFARQGVGKLLMDAILERDYPQVQGTVLLFAIAVILVNVAVDITYKYLDPRIRL